ncbi:MAG: S8 family serine peptidase, partial [Bacteroidota bacterium]
SIRSAWYTSNTATTAISGTSMASPHVAGAAALVLAGSPGASPVTVNAAVLGAVTDNAVGNARSANNDLLFVGSGGSQPPPPPPSQISLDVQGRYYWRYSIVDLSWSGAQSSQVDVYVNGSRAATTTNDGAQSYNLGWNRRGTYAFTVCERGTSSCSPSVSVRF